MTYPFPNAGLLRPTPGYGRGLLSGPGPLDDEFARLRMMNAQTPMMAMQYTQALPNVQPQQPQHPRYMMSEQSFRNMFNIPESRDLSAWYGQTSSAPRGRMSGDDLKALLGG